MKWGFQHGVPWFDGLRIISTDRIGCGMPLLSQSITKSRTMSKHILTRIRAYSMRIWHFSRRWMEGRKSCLHFLVMPLISWLFEASLIGPTMKRLSILEQVHLVKGLDRVGRFQEYNTNQQCRESKYPNCISAATISSLEQPLQQHPLQGSYR